MKMRAALTLLQKFRKEFQVLLAGVYFWAETRLASSLPSPPHTVMLMAHKQQLTQPK